MTVTLRRGIAIGGLIVAIAASAIWVARRNDGPSAVLGSKLQRCRTVEDATAVSAGSRRLSAENAPLTVTVSDGRVESVLAPAVKVEPGAISSARVASFTIGSPRTSGGALIADVTIQNLTDCTARVSLAQAVARREGGGPVSSPIRFGGNLSATMSSGQRLTGSFSVPLAGDGTYEITASTDSEIGLVR